MQESKLLGTLLPSSPDLLPIIRQMREKYGLPEIGPDDEPIGEIFIDGEPVALEVFHQEIRSLVQALPDLLLPRWRGYYNNSGRALASPLTFLGWA